MTAQTFLNGRVMLHAGDCLAVLPTLPENSVDSVCTDPPYELAFMNRAWDRTGIAFRPETWAAVLRVLKPGGHMVAFAAPKNAHRMVCAIEDAGFEIRDCLMWLFGSGFPKSLDVSKAIDKAAGTERKVIRARSYDLRNDGGYSGGLNTTRPRSESCEITVPATDAARAWEGWGTALKPAYEPICLARKPLSEQTIAANVLCWGTGAINIGACRVAGEPTGTRNNNVSLGSSSGGIYGAAGGFTSEGSPFGRWPANVLHDGSEEVVPAFPETSSGALNAGHKQGSGSFGSVGGDIIARDYGNDSGSAARFFYTAKADSDDRIGSKHPTVKPLDLMQYLVRLVTPPRGVVLDIFAGTGTTGEAAWREGFSAILIEREPEYLADIERRMKLCLAGPDERARESIKARLKDKPMDAGPLFGGEAA